MAFHWSFVALPPFEGTLPARSMLSFEEARETVCGTSVKGSVEVILVVVMG